MINSSSDLSKRIKKNLRALNVLPLINELDKIGEVIFLGGYVRDRYLGTKFPSRDIDIVIKFIDEKESLEKSVLEKISGVKSVDSNRYGGFKIFLDNAQIDIWDFKETWGFKKNPELLGTGEWSEIINTVYTNMDAIAYNYSIRKFKADNIFFARSNLKEPIIIKQVAEDNPDKEQVIAKLLVNVKKHNKHFAHVEYSNSIKKDIIKYGKKGTLYKKQLERYKRPYFSESELKDLINSFHQSY